MIKPYKITGTIGDKSINITKGSSIKEAKDENDILTTVISLSGYKLNAKNGNFGLLELSEQAQKEQMEALMMQQMQNQQMQMQTMGMF